jgi:hypothetical protein
MRNNFEKGMAEDLQSIEEMFEKNDFSKLDDIYRKYFIPHLDEPIHTNAH